MTEDPLIRSAEGRNEDEVFPTEQVTLSAESEADEAVAGDEEQPKGERRFSLEKSWAYATVIARWLASVFSALLTPAAAAADHGVDALRRGARWFDTTHAPDVARIAALFFLGLTACVTAVLLLATVAKDLLDGKPWRHSKRCSDG